MNEDIGGFQKMVGERKAGHILILVKLFLLVLVIYFGVSAAKLWDTRPTGELPRQLAVAGQGKTMVRPDIAVFTAGTITQAQRVKDAQAQNTAKSNAVIDFLKKNGVEDKDIKTTEYAIYPQYESVFPPPCASGEFCPRTLVRSPQIVSYQVRQTIEIKARDLGKTDDLLAGVVLAGANEVGSVTFRVDDPEAARAVARKKAIDDAKAKAQTLADNLGVRLKKIVSYTDENTGYQPYAAQGFAEARTAGAVPPPAPSPQVQPGEQEITSNVTIVYEFR